MGAGAWWMGENKGTWGAPVIVSTIKNFLVHIEMSSFLKESSFLVINVIPILYDFCQF